MSTRIIDILIKNNAVNQVLKTIFKEKSQGKPGVTISELSEKTGIERHRLAGILEVLVVLGILVVFEMGMMKLIAPTETLLKAKSILSTLK